MDSSTQLASDNDVDHAIRSVAAAIIADYNTSPLFVALLRGAAPFASKLMFEITRQAPNYHPELDYMMVSTYGSGKTAGEPQIITDLAPTTSITGRDVVIIDDVLDKAVTAHFVMDHLAKRGAAQTHLAVLVTKQTKRRYPITADYSCFDLPDLWLIGMGMDDGDKGTEQARWLGEIYSIDS